MFQIGARFIKFGIAVSDYLEKEVHDINKVVNELQLSNSTVFASHDLFGKAEVDLDDARVLVSELASYTERKAGRVIHWYKEFIKAGRVGDFEHSIKCIQQLAREFTSKGDNKKK